MLARHHNKLRALPSILSVYVEYIIVRLSFDFMTAHYITSIIIVYAILIVSLVLL